MAVSTVDRDRLFRQFRNSLGSSVVSVEITDEILDSSLEMAIEDYAEIAQNQLIENQWFSLFGTNVTTAEFVFGLSVPSIDFSTRYSYAYSKQVGLQGRGPWELKKDYIEIEAGKQSYLIPAGREVNEVLWFSPNATTAALFANTYGGVDAGGFGGGFAQVGAGGVGINGGFGGGYYAMQSYDTLLLAQDLTLKSKLLRGDLTYKITANSDGGRILHLMSTPGSRLSFGMGVSNSGLLSLAGCQVWYHYYDTTPENLDQCRKDNPDIIRLPNDVILSKLDFSNFNEPTKVLIRQLFIAHAKRALGRIRGKYSGIIGPPGAQQTMDYESLLTEGTAELEAVRLAIGNRLLRYSSTAMLERAALEAEYLNRQLKFRPLGIYKV